MGGSEIYKNHINFCHPLHDVDLLTKHIGIQKFSFAPNYINRIKSTSYDLQRISNGAYRSKAKEANGFLVSIVRGSYSINNNYYRITLISFHFDFLRCRCGIVIPAAERKAAAIRHKSSSSPQSVDLAIVFVNFTRILTYSVDL